MADMKIPANLPTVARPLSGARTEALRAAQKAFFNAAMSDAQSAAPPPPKAEAKTTPKAPAGEPAPAGNGTTRYLRPGSRLDIKV